MPPWPVLLSGSCDLEVFCVRSLFTFNTPYVKAFLVSFSKRCRCDAYNKCGSGLIALAAGLPTAGLAAAFGGSAAAGLNSAAALFPVALLGCPFLAAARRI
jgi:hypothetical protein